MAVVRLALASVVALVAVPAAHGATKPLRAPQQLQAFLLRADEPAAHEFPRTPAFSWAPVKGAQRYEFTLSTSPLKAGSGLVWDDASLTSPTATVRIALPWITGNPYSLYARVRGIAPNGSVGPWSAPYGFNIRWANVPAQLPAGPGYVRWTPVEGATYYQVWYLNAGTNGRSKTFTTTTNVADEREYYAFHEKRPDLYQFVTWRVRAVRAVLAGPRNKLPAVSYGPWSPVFMSSNPQLLANQRLAPVGTASDVTYDAGAPGAHGLMPAFLFSASEHSDGTSSLYRVYAFTDRDCVNLVYKGSIVAGPAFAPRTSGPLAVPHEQAAVDTAVNNFLPDAKDEGGGTFTFDGGRVDAAEAQQPTTFTITKTSGSGGSSGSGSSGGSSGSSGSGSSAGADSTSDPTQLPEKIPGVGAPVDLWDTSWPTGGYYWTVMQVNLVTRTTALAADAAAGRTTIIVGDSNQFQPGDNIVIDIGSKKEVATVEDVNGGQLTITALKYSHNVGATVVRQAGAIEYWDDAVIQDACAAGRIGRFGKESEPAVSTSRVPYVSGLSPNGRLVAAAGTKPVFYGAAVVAWRPALGASLYELQVSKTRYPWRAYGDSQWTFATSTTLPLKPGTWYYRVRGIDLALPDGAQQMTWSEPVGLVVAKPKYRVVAK